MAEDTRTYLLIAGMRNNACRERIAGVLERLPGVRQVDVSLLRGQAAIVHAPECRVEDLVETVARAGFSAKLRAA